MATHEDWQKAVDDYNFEMHRYMLMRDDLERTLRRLRAAVWFMIGAGALNIAAAVARIGGWLR